MTLLYNFMSIQDNNILDLNAKFVDLLVEVGAVDVAAVYHVFPGTNSGVQEVEDEDSRTLIETEAGATVHLGDVAPPVSLAIWRTHL